jgi:hypothetical protein
MRPVLLSGRIGLFAECFVLNNLAPNIVRKYKTKPAVCFILRINADDARSSRTMESHAKAIWDLSIAPDRSL